MAFETASKDFFLGSIEALRGLDANAKPEWGSMSPQRMVEHLVGSWRISNGRAKVKVISTPEELKVRRDFLFSDLSYERNLTNPIFAKGEPPLRKPSLNAAIDQLEDEMKAFFAYHEANPDTFEVHPVFGNLDYDGWMLFQTKHMGHHLAQFGIS